MYLTPSALQEQKQHSDSPPPASALTSQQEDDALKSFLSSCGLEPWYETVTKHLGVRTVDQLCQITAEDIWQLKTKANMKLQVLAAKLTMYYQVGV
jgi:predicted flap endonuclease-1-like 5' DNA nuclease